MCLGNSMVPKKIKENKETHEHTSTTTLSTKIVYTTILRSLILCLVSYTDNSLCILVYCARSCAYRHLHALARLWSHPLWILDRVWLPRGQQHIGRRSAKEKCRRASEPLRAIACGCYQIAMAPRSCFTMRTKDTLWTLQHNRTMRNQWKHDETSQSSIIFGSKQCSVGVLIPLKPAWAWASWFVSESRLWW